jgi:hypothetical protein
VLTWTTESLPQVPSAVLVERSRHGLSIIIKSRLSFAVFSA